MSNTPLEITEKWLIQYVLKLNLCPFAIKTMADKSYFLNETTLLETPVSVQHTISNLTEQSDLSTAFIVMTDDLSLDQGLLWYEFIQDLIDEMGYSDLYELVFFHPDYLHDQISEDSPTHYSNRSPFPIVQFLRIPLMEALNAHEMTGSILKNNEKTLTEIGVESLQKELYDLTR